MACFGGCGADSHLRLERILSLTQGVAAACDRCASGCVCRQHPQRSSSHHTGRVSQPSWAGPLAACLPRYPCLHCRLGGHSQPVRKTARNLLVLLLAASASFLLPFRHCHHFSCTHLASPDDSLRADTLALIHPWAVGSCASRCQKSDSGCLLLTPWPQCCTCDTVALSLPLPLRPIFSPRERAHSIACCWRAGGSWCCYF